MLPDPQPYWQQLPCFRRKYSGRSFEIPMNNPNGYRKGQGTTNNLIVTSKFTWYNFLPLSLLQQYRKISIIYFTVVMAINLIPAVSPYLPVTSILPLVFVLAASMIKEAVEDAARHREDRATNNRKYEVLKSDGTTTQVKSQDLKPGHVLRILNGQPIPADLVELKSSGDSYLMTANLDGETNLKPRSPCGHTMNSSVEEIAKLRDSIEVELPKQDLYNLVARYKMPGGQTVSLGDDNFIQRGAKLVNTDWILGVVVYVGADTRLALNQKAPPTKYSVLERQLNWFVLVMFLVLQFVCIMLAIGTVIFNHVKYNNDSYDELMGKQEETGFLLWLLRYATYFVLLSVFVPISLWVTMEIVRFVQARFMQWDKQMYSTPEEGKKRKKKPKKNDDESSSGAAEPEIKGMVAKTSSLNEDLGRIEHIFSDKTGTLTQNKMTYRYTCIGRGELFDAKIPLGEKLKEGDEKVTPLANAIADFMRVLALCHGIVPSVDEDGELVYRTPSPDEVALAKYAGSCGYRFIKKNGDILTVEELGVEKTYKLLALCDFTSHRRRMTVLIRHMDTGRCQALVKGADSKIYELLRPDPNDANRAVTSERLREFSRQGLRTLAIAKRELTKAEEDAFMEKYRVASNELEDRANKLDAVYVDIESNLELVGATAVEDNLQDEVPETIVMEISKSVTEYLLRCGIQVWVLTGDKKETAENIGFSTRLLQEGMELMEITSPVRADCAAKVEELHSRLPLGEDVSDTSILNRALIVEGPCLEHLLSPQLSDRFIELTRHMKSVVCCRTIPSYKALVVKGVRTKEKKVCLAVGDGANDVSMIQEAHVGVGIFGKEGTQAARASDYAIHEFKHLRRLIAIHGRYSYLRNTGVILYSFYKNLTFTLPLIYFAFFSGFSGQTMYDQWVITFFNIAFASVPPLIYGFFEKDIPESVILRHPEVYKYYQRGVLFTWKRICIWIFAAIFHSSAIWWLIWAVYRIGSGIDGTMRESGLWAMGLVMSTAGVLIVNLRMAIEARYWTFITHIAIWGSILFYLSFIFVYASFYYITLGFYSSYHVPYELARMPAFWLLVITTIVIALLPDFLFKYIQWTYFPQDWQILHERELYGIHAKEDLVRSMKHARADAAKKEKGRTSPNGNGNGSHSQELEIIPA